MAIGTATALALGATAAATAGGIASASGGRAPAARDLYAESRDSLQAQIDLAPALLASERQYRPEYAALDNQTLEAMLFGSPERQVQVAEASGGLTRRFIPTGGTVPQGAVFISGQQGTRGGQTGAWYNVPDGTTVNRTQTVAAQRGLLDILGEVQPQTDALAAESASRQRAADVADVERYGAQAISAIRNADPANAELLRLLNEQVATELAAGGKLSSRQAREVEQGVRAGQAARGFGFGPNDVLNEAVARQLEGERLREQRLRNAVTTVGVNQATGADIFQAILGRPSQGSNAAAALVGQGQAGAANSGPTLFDPQNAYAQDLYNTNYNANAAARISRGNNMSAIFGSLLGTAGQIGAAGYN